MSMSILIKIAGLFVGLFRIVLGVKTWQSNRSISQNQLSLQYKVALSDQHKKYQDILSASRKETRPAIDAISRIAHQQLNVLLAYFDEHSNKTITSRHTRHVCHHLCEMVFGSFGDQLTWQHGLYLNDQYRRLRFAEVDLRIDNEAVRQLEKDAEKEHCDFANQYLDNPNPYAFERLEASATFVTTLHDLTSRFSSDSGQNLFSDGLSCVNSYREVHAKWRDTINQQIGILEEGLQQNECEEFPLHQSPLLYQRYTEQIRRLEILDTFSLPDWGGGPFPYKVDLPVSQMLYAACVLYTVSSYHNWGVDNK